MHATTLRRGMTLVELLVLIATIGVLVGLLLPAAGVSVNPAATQMTERDEDTNPANRMAWAGASWTVFILPFLEQKPLNDAYDHSRP